MIQPCGYRRYRPSGKSFLALAVFLILSFLPFSSAESFQASFIPWSGYWWPYTHGGLGTGLDYRGRPSPLEKYNLLTTGVTSGTPLDEYLYRYYDPTAPSWHGLCLFWARAACYEHFNSILPSSEENVVFRIGDKKGLLTLAHDNDIIANGVGSNPEEFHFWLLKYIKDEKKAFVADLYAGEEVWSHPIYRYDMISSISGDTESVRVRVYYASDFIEPDYRGTSALNSEYTYDLFLDATGAITGGEWTGASVADHPEILSIPLGVGANLTGLDYHEVLRLAGSRDDYLEDGDRSVEIGPGTYNLILLDEDVYTISAAAGDVLSLRIEKEEGSMQDIDAVVTDGFGNEVRRAVVAEGSPLDEHFTLATPPYTIRLSQDDYADPNIYVLKADMKRPFNQEVPYIPGAGAWSGFALTNPGSAAVEGVALTTEDADGAPIQTVLGPLSLGPGEKRVFFFDDLPVRLTELSKTDRLFLTAEGPVVLLNLIGDGDRFLTAFVQGGARGFRLVIPDTARPMTPGVRMFGGVRNESFEDAAVSLHLYSSDGVLQKEVARTIAARGWLAVQPGCDPFYTMPGSGWIEILGERALTGKQPLSGFQYLSNAYGVETLFALQVGATKKIIPHIADPDQWITEVTLINPNDSENPVKLHPALAGLDSTADMDIVLAPREKRTLELQNQFGKRQGEPFYRSILEITGLYPLAGYFSYSVPGDRDRASYPLLDSSYYKGKLSLPHYPAGDSFWWTGAVVCNPSTLPVTVIIEPYDHDGNLIEGSVQSVDLDPGEYDVFDVAIRFAEAESEISFLNFRTEDDAGTLGGFYLYGDRGIHILSGAIMQ